MPIRYPSTVSPPLIVVEYVPTPSYFNGQVATNIKGTFYTSTTDLFTQIPKS